jgi:prepilin peptidase dependent protein B
MVELLIGIAVGLFVLAGATMVASNQIADNKKLLLETQVQQDMRTAMDVIVRDIRRSGFSHNADVLQSIGAPLAPPSGYKAAGVMDPADVLLYTYYHPDSKDPKRSTDNNTADPSLPEDGPDFKGFRLKDGIIQVQLGLNNWQALTDPAAIEITRFVATQVLGEPANIPACDTPAACPSTNGCGTQRVVTRYINLEMVGRARHDQSVQRRLDARVRVRNDEVCL